MNERYSLEHEITSGLTELRELVGSCSTYSVAGSCLAHLIVAANGPEPEERLLSPAKQIPFLLGVLLSGPEPEDPVHFGKDQWDRARSLLDKLFTAYMSLYMPPEEEAGDLAPDWIRVREVSMLAFLHYFNTGFLASTHQVAERIRTYLCPYDAELSEVLRINASQALAICEWIADRLQTVLDDLAESVKAEHAERLEILQRARREEWSPGGLSEAVRQPSYVEKAKKLVSGLTDLGLVKLPELEVAFPGIADVFWHRFSMHRGEGPEIRYPTEQSIFDERPLIRISDTKAICPLVNTLFTAVLLIGERTLMQGSTRARYLRSRDKALEDEALDKIKCFLSPEASIWSEVYETPDSQFEHDIVAVDEGLYLLVEAKASPPIEPFRDPDKAFVRLRDAFRADTGIQKAYDQGSRIVRRLNAGSVVPLYDERGGEVGRLLPDKSKLPVVVCVTRDNFGGLATNLTFLLEKGADDSFPWVVNIIDLGSLAEAWSYFGWGSAELRKYLEQRIQLHGKVFSDDELDYAGYFVRHGNFDSAIEVRADLLQLNHGYSSIFDEVYRHLHFEGPPVKLQKTKPVLMDLRRSLVSNQPVFVDTEVGPFPRRKIGRNEPCPCGSGKKYKRCCGQPRSDLLE